MALPSYYVPAPGRGTLPYAAAKKPPAQTDPFGLSSAKANYMLNPTAVPPKAAPAPAGIKPPPVAGPMASSIATGGVNPAGAKQNTAPTSATLYDLNTDPALQQTLSLTGMSDEQAQAAAGKQRRDLLLNYGDPNLSNSVLGDPSLAAAAAANPTSTLNQLASQRDTGIHDLTEQLNQANLLYSGYRTTQEQKAGTDYQNALASAAGQVNTGLEGVTGSLNAALGSNASARAQAAGDAFNRQLQALLLNPPAPPDTTPAGVGYASTDLDPFGQIALANASSGSWKPPTQAELHRPDAAGGGGEGELMALLPMAASIANGPGAAYIAARRDAVRTANQTPGTIIDAGPRAGPKAGIITKSRVVPAAAGFPGPLQPWSPAQIAAITARIQGQFGTPRTQAQIQADAQGQISPIIAALTKAATDRASGASAAIKGLTDSYAAQLAGENFQAPYQQAEQGQAAVDAALQQSLAGGGASLAADLKGRLGQINDPSVAAAASGLADRGAALGTTQLASGSSALSELIANAASAGEYGLKQPVIARNAGIQGVAQAQAQATNDIATGTQATLTQLPQIVQALESSNASLRSNRADAAASLFGTLTGQNITKATLRAGLSEKTTAAQAAVTAAQIKANASAAAAQTKAAAKSAADAEKNAKPNSAMTRTINDGFLHDGDGYVVVRNGKPVKVAYNKPSTKNPAGYTLHEQAQYNGMAAALAAGVANGAINPDTNKPYTYEEAIQEAVKSQIPPQFMASQLSILNIFPPSSPRGAVGRPTKAKPAGAGAGLTGPVGGK